MQILKSRYRKEILSTLLDSEITEQYVATINDSNSEYQIKYLGQSEPAYAGEKTLSLSTITNMSDTNNTIFNTISQNQMIFVASLASDLNQMEEDILELCNQTLMGVNYICQRDAC